MDGVQNNHTFSMQSELVGATCTVQALVGLRDKSVILKIACKSGYIFFMVITLQHT